jgi:hypothetical protein
VSKKLLGFVPLLAIALFIECSNPTTSASSAKAITYFSIFSTSGNISGTTIIVTFPYYPINVAALTATFTTTGNLVTVNGVTQVSGSTINNFTSPVSYLVTAQDGSTSTYTVTVIVPNSCTDDSGCAPGYYCQPLNCVAKLAPGAACAANDQCQSGDCSSGFCK